ncbi:hypothetical protein FKP32DRAFT_360038 [Trametes sanguinea]|nr:hypothetical protein FKP32DRAFT_360038 [Trametes sanguinea]
MSPLEARAHTATWQPREVHIGHIQTCDPFTRERYPSNYHLHPRPCPIYGSLCRYLAASTSLRRGACGQAGRVPKGKDLDPPLYSTSASLQRTRTSTYMFPAKKMTLATEQWIHVQSATAHSLIQVHTHTPQLQFFVSSNHAQQRMKVPHLSGGPSRATQIRHIIADGAIC